MSSHLLKQFDADRLPIHLGGTSPLYKAYVNSASNVQDVQEEVVQTQIENELGGEEEVREENIELVVSREHTTDIHSNTHSDSKRATPFNASSKSEETQQHTQQHTQQQQQQQPQQQHTHTQQQQPTFKLEFAFGHDLIDTFL